MINVSFHYITGMMVGFELVYANDTTNLVVDLFIVRLVFAYEG